MYSYFTSVFVHLSLQINHGRTRRTKHYAVLFITIHFRVIVFRAEETAVKLRKRGYKQKLHFRYNTCSDINMTDSLRDMSGIEQFHVQT